MKLKINTITKYKMNKYKQQGKERSMQSSTVNPCRMESYVLKVLDTTSDNSKW